jgi:hypothetical protein
VAVLAFTVVFQADFETLYNASATTRDAFERKFVAGLQATAPSASIVVDSVLPGSIRVATRVAFPGAYGGGCSAASDTVTCDRLSYYLSSSPASIFATGPLSTMSASFEGVMATYGGMPLPAPPPPVMPGSAAQRAARPWGGSVGYSLAALLLGWHTYA